jgi:hypothetical protein
MGLINEIPISTKFGLRTIQIYNDDITRINWEFDVLVLSAFKGGYNPVKGSLIKSLLDNSKVDIREFSNKPKFDFRENLNCWLSSDLPEETSFKRILCLEGISSTLESTGGIKELMSNLYGFISFLSYKKIDVSKIAMPLLGSGNQGNDVNKILPELIESSKQALECNPNIKTICFVEMNENKASLINDYVNDFLGRGEEQISEYKVDNEVAIHINDIIKYLNKLVELIPTIEKKEEFINLLDKLSKKNIVQYQIFGRLRVFTELILREVIIVKHLKKNVSLYDYWIEMSQREYYIPEWVSSYVHIIRIAGNYESHVKKDTRIAMKYLPEDFEILLLSFKSILKYYTDNFQLLRDCKYLSNLEDWKCI